MKKLLIIAHSFPPSNASGARRPFGLAKYLPKFGWEPIVLTPKLSRRSFGWMRVIETDYKDVLSSLKSKFGFNPEKGLHEQLGIAVSKEYNYPTLKSKIVKLIKEIIIFPDEKRGWYDFALKSASEFLDTEKVNAIISTSPPIITHLIAKKLKRKYKIPWIADFRDLWDDPYIDYFGFIKYLENKLESRTLSNVDALVTVTNPWVDILKERYQNKKIFCVTNGYDEDDFSKSPLKRTSKFTLTYTGTLYNGKRDPELLFKVISQLINKNKIDRDLIEIRFFCNKEEWLLNDIRRYNLEGVAFCYGIKPREEVLEKQKESQLLLILRWDNKLEETFCPGKIYEYLGARRPIIAIGGPGGVVKDLLEMTSAGKLVRSPDLLRNILLEFYQEFIKSGEVKCHSNSNIEKYTYNSIAKKYSTILDGILKDSIQG